VSYTFFDVNFSILNCFFFKRTAWRFRWSVFLKQFLVPFFLRSSVSRSPTSLSSRAGRRSDYLKFYLFFSVHRTLSTVWRQLANNEVPEESHLVEPTHLLGENIGTQKALIGANFVFQSSFRFCWFIARVVYLHLCICLSHSRKNKNQSRSVDAFESLIALFLGYLDSKC
jgi:hypothetical protein